MSISNLYFFATLFVLFSVIFGNAQGTYLAHAELPVYGLISVEIILIFANKIIKNRLLDILNLHFIIFFLLRIPFVYSDNVISDIYIRNVNVAEVSNALYWLGLQLIVLSACVVYINPIRVTHLELSISNKTLYRVLRFTAFILVVNVAYITLYFKSGENILLSGIAIIYALFNYGTILMFLVPLLILIDKNITLKYRLYLYAQLATCVFLVMYTGNKSGIFIILEVLSSIILIIHGASYRISLRMLLLAMVSLVIASVMYLLGDLFNKLQRAQIDISEAYSRLTQSLDHYSLVLNSISYRIGYLDFYIDKATQPIYASTFQLKYYFMAVIDALTPGFDVWGDVPLVSRAVYNSMFEKSDGPNSEAITVFAESINLFGIFFFIPYLFVLFVLYFLRRCFRTFSNDFEKVIFICFIGLCFEQYLIGFGLDYWIIGSVIYPLTTIYLSFKIIRLNFKSL